MEYDNEGQVIVYIPASVHQKSIAGVCEQIANMTDNPSLIVEDPDTGSTYLLIGCNLPSGIYAEIDDGTWGSLEGFRFKIQR